MNRKKSGTAPRGTLSGSHRKVTTKQHLQQRTAEGFTDALKPGTMVQVGQRSPQIRFAASSPSLAEIPRNPPRKRFLDFGVSRDRFNDAGLRIDPNRMGASLTFQEADGARVPIASSDRNRLP
jgi:hypothetical protein